MIRVRVVSVAGSAPREVGAEMLVGLDTQTGTIGGGALEWRATQIARDMLTAGENEREETFPLGPSLGQCCGGSARLGFAVAEEFSPHIKRPLWVWGAGHVGRAFVHTFQPLPDFEITWIDTTTERYPDQIPEGITQLVASDPVRVVQHAPVHSDHLIVTYSHDLDLKLCDSLLHHGFSSCGLIGSATKWARFQSRLQSLGHRHEQIARIACPIGDPQLGKHPQAIAVGVAASLLGREKNIEHRGDKTG